MITMLKSVSCNRDALFWVAAEDIKGNSSFSCFAGGHVCQYRPPVAGSSTMPKQVGLCIVILGGESFKVGD